MKTATRTWAFIGIFLCAGAIDIWSMGYREKPLDYVDNLIINQRYDEAIVFLTAFIKSNPSLFDSAQSRLKRITLIRSAYNASAATLIEVLKNDPLNQARKLAIIAELESYEKVPNPAVMEFVAKTKELALFTYNQAQFESIMDQGRTLIDGRKFIAALEIYESGFTLYNQEFRSSGFDQSIIEDAFSRVEIVSEEINRFAGYALAMNAAFAELAASYSASEDHAYTAAWNDAVSISADFAALRNNVIHQGRTLEAHFVDIAAHDAAITDNSFLPFAFRLVLGRKGGDNFEGIAGTLDAYWTSTLGAAQSAVDETLQSAKTIAREAYEHDDWPGAIAALLSVARNAERKASLLSLWSRYAQSDLVERATAMGQTALSLKGSAYLASIHTARTARSFASLAQILVELDSESLAMLQFKPALTRQGDENPVLEAFEQHRAAFEEASRKLETLARTVAETGNAMKAWTLAGFGSTESRSETELLDGALARALQKSSEMQIRAVASAAAWEFGSLLAESEQAEALLDDAKNSLNGIPAQDPALQGILLRYPVQANRLFSMADALAGKILTDTSSYLSRYDAYPDFISESSDMMQWTKSAGILAARLRADQAEAKKMSITAQEQKNLADYNRREAENRISELKTALASNNFIAAKDRLNLARDRYQTSLEFEYDESLRNSSDKILSDLATVVRKAENDLVVADSRLYLKRCKESYLHGELEQAESALLQARMTWSTTNARPDFEIEYWLRLIKNSLGIQNERSMPVTASAFPEASQALAAATRSFEEGSAYLAKRDRTAAVNSFSLARQHILDVKAVFPSSPEAEILELKIDQATDAPLFAKKCQQLFTSAKSRIEANHDLPAAYNDLKILQSVQPQFHGLKTLMEQTEIMIGFKPTPPDSNAKADAKNLVQSAQRIFDRGDMAQLVNIYEVLEKAMLLDPGLESVGVLKDKVALRLGGDAAMVLPSVAEAFYKEATRYFEKGDFVKARDRLANVMATFPEGKSLKKVADLDVRLDAMGY